jgi:hypothetical protein
MEYTSTQHISVLQSSPAIGKMGVFGCFILHALQASPLLVGKNIGGG